MVRDCFPGGDNTDLLPNSDIVNFLLKTNEGRDRRPNFVIFVVFLCSNCRQVGGGGLGQKVVLRAD